MPTVQYETPNGTETETPDEAVTNDEFTVLLWRDGDGNNDWRMKVPNHRIVRIEEQL